MERTVDDDSIRLRWVLALMLVVGGAVSGYAFLGILGVHADARSVGAIVGGAAWMALVPALFAVPWRIVQRRRQQVTNAPVVVAGLIFAALAVMVLAGASVDASL